MSESTRGHSDVDELYEAAGYGAFVGVIAALLSHWVMGEPVGLIMLFCWGVSLYRLRGWREQVGLLALLGTTVTYFAIREVYRLANYGWVGSLGITIMIIVGLGCYLAATVSWVIRTRSGLIARAEWISVSEARARPFDNSESWEEPHYKRMRARRLAHQRTLVAVVRPLLLAATGLLASLWLSSPVAVGIAASVYVYNLILSASLLTYHLRLQQPGAADLLVKDLRPHVLYLRSFALDRLPVDRLDDGWRGLLDMFSPQRRTFEERVAIAFVEVGPLIAVGRPEEDAPPLGAAREYSDEQSWRQLVLERARSAQLVIIAVEATPSIEWEIDSVAEHVGLQRLLLLLPPGSDPDEERGLPWYEGWGHLRRRFAFLPEVLPETDAVLFDLDDQPVALATGIKSIDGRLEAVKNEWWRRGGNTVLDSWNSAATELLSAGKYEEAREVLSLVLAIRLRLSDEADSDALIVQSNLGHAYSVLGDFQPALELLSEALDGQRTKLGADDPATLTTQHNLAAVHDLVGNSERSRELHVETLLARRRVLGDDHPDTLQSQNNLANVLRSLGETEAARDLYVRTLDCRMRLLGDEHVDTLTTQNNLANVLAELGEHTEASALLQHTHEVQRRVLGENHPNTLISQLNLAHNLRSLDRTDDAHRLLETLYPKLVKTFGIDHPYVEAVRSEYGSMLNL